jgi:hypothetical protein
VAESVPPYASVSTIKCVLSTSDPRSVRQDLRSALLLVDLAGAQDDAEAQYTDIGSGEQIENTTPRDPSSAEENDEDLQWHHPIPSDKAAVHQSVGEQRELDKTVSRNITENSKPRDFFFLYVQTILAVIVQETNRYIQQDAQARNKADIPYSEEISIKEF